jgi:hexosaminidase
MATPHRSTRPLGAALVCALVACHNAPAPSTVPAPTPEPPPVPATMPAPQAAVPSRPDPNPLQTQPPLTSLGAHHLVPMPVSVTAADGAPFTIDAATSIVVPAGGGEVARIGQAFATLLRPSTGAPIPVYSSTGAAPRGAIVLRLGGDASMGQEGYELTVSADSVTMVAASPAGLFYATQTLRQLLPAGVEAEQSAIRPASAWTVPPGRVVDRPRFGYRGMMLDVARHFFTVDEVKQLVDILALYKVNTLHLHLADDQGWRIEIKRWPKLTTVGGSSEVAGRGGGFYTKADYAELVRYAREQYVTIVPEIDMPAHTQAAIASYPELGCGRPVPSPSPNAPAGLYTGVQVGFSALCHDKPVTYKFVDDVVRELAELTPGPFIHLGGDEVQVLNHEQYAAFVERVQDIAAKHGKRMIGWDEIGRAKLRPGTVAQMWRSDTSMAAARQGAKLVMSPATNAYLDMKYTLGTETGHRWAAIIELRTAYEWDPVTHFPGVTEPDVLGVEGALWTETVRNITGAEYLVLPRLPAIAELGWSPTAGRDWESFRGRIAAHAPRWRWMNANFYASPQVDWEP